MADIDIVQQSDFDDHNAQHEDGGSDEMNVAGLSGVLADQQDPQSHANERHTENFIPDTELGSANGVATLNGDSVLSSAQLPDLAITDTFTVSAESDLTTLSDAEIGDVGIVTSADPDTNNAFILTGDFATQSNWVALQTPTSPVQSVNGYTGDVTIASDDVGSPSDAEFNTHAGRHESGGADEMNVGGLPGVLADQQDPQAHANERHTENFTTDTHDHSGGTAGSDTLNPTAVKPSDQLDVPQVSTRSDIPTGQTGLYYIQDEDTVTFRVS